MLVTMHTYPAYYRFHNDALYKSTLYLLTYYGLYMSKYIHDYLHDNYKK